MSLEIKVVARPTGNGTTTVQDDLVQALIDAKDTDKAIEVQLTPDTNFINWQSTLRNRLRKHNLKLRARLNKGKKTVIAWVEDLE